MPAQGSPVYPCTGGVMSHAGDHDAAASLVGLGLGSAAQVEEALALVEGDFDAALQLLLAQAGDERPEAAAAADEPLVDAPPLADETLDLLMELAPGCSLLDASKELARRVATSTRCSGCSRTSARRVTSPTTRRSRAPRSWVGTPWLGCDRRAARPAGSGMQCRPAAAAALHACREHGLARICARAPARHGARPAWRETAAWAACPERRCRRVPVAQSKPVELLLECCHSAPGSADTTEPILWWALLCTTTLLARSTTWYVPFCDALIWSRRERPSCARLAVRWS